MRTTQLALFLVAATTLILELLLTRAFDVILTPNLAYMVIACAMFSFGLAGIYIAVRPISEGTDLDTPPEGQEIQVPYRGSVVQILHRVRGHLRSAVSYGGAASLSELRAEVLSDPLSHLVELSDASRRESYER